MLSLLYDISRHRLDPESILDRNLNAAELMAEELIVVGYWLVRIDLKPGQLLIPLHSRLCIWSLFFIFIIAACYTDNHTTKHLEASAQADKVIWRLGGKTRCRPFLAIVDALRVYLFLPYIFHLC